MHVTRVLGKLEPGGAQLALLRLSRELRRRHGVTTRLLVGDASDEGLRLARSYGVPVEAFRSGPTVHPIRNLQWECSQRYALWLQPELADAELVHAHMVGAWWAAAQVVGPRTALVATEHNEVNWTDRRVRALRPAAARVDRFYAMGPAARRFAVAAGVPSQLVHASRSPVAGLSSLGSPLTSGGPRLTFAGRFCLDKGADVLVEALALLDRPDLTAWLLGDGPLRAQLDDRIARLGLADRVRLPGWVDKPWTFVAGSAVHVVPSREEAWSQSAVLGLGLGVPVVGTRVDGLADTLADGRGLLVAPEDPPALAAAIEQALDRTAAIDRLGALRYARGFTPARVADFYLAAYRGLLDRTGVDRLSA